MPDPREHETVEEHEARWERMYVTYALKDIRSAIAWLERRPATAHRYSDLLDSLRGDARVLEGEVTRG